MREKVLLTWSGGKDSALALHKMQNSNEYKVEALLTTITAEYDRISLHGIRSALLEKQANSLGYKLEKIFIPKNCSNEEYNFKMQTVLEKYSAHGINKVVFGDIFLEDVRSYREKNLKKIGMTGIFPLWKRDTSELAQIFINLGFKAIITCIDTKALDKTFISRAFDEQFLKDLPTNIDPCGENGEFHTFVYDGPLYKRRIIFSKGDVILRNEQFYFCDLLSG
jgi:uncharacterized protein (TIGR00290 family)